ncbi:hypothetical protein L798_02595 [Zootermopsis nevadensis]|uniref:Uncharacterized protein n=1 Tax=Zootermopsis nevadensis TaxID=136037 RepID=A0A067QG88_ZOONE|nr:hypothetical protein L798_02595 [Zootermopsis nevadensis]
MGIVHTWDCTRGTSYSVIVSRSYKAYLRMRRDSRFVDAQRPYQNTKIDEDIKPKITIPPIQHTKPRKGIGTSGATGNADKSLHRTLMSTHEEKSAVSRAGTNGYTAPFHKMCPPPQHNTLHCHSCGNPYQRVGKNKFQLCNEYLSRGTISKTIT